MCKIKCYFFFFYVERCHPIPSGTGAVQEQQDAHLSANNDYEPLAGKLQEAVSRAPTGRRHESTTETAAQCHGRDTVRLPCTMDRNSGTANRAAHLQSTTGMRTVV